MRLRSGSENTGVTGGTEKPSPVRAQNNLSMETKVSYVLSMVYDNIYMMSQVNKINSVISRKKS